MRHFTLGMLASLVLLAATAFAQNQELLKPHLINLKGWKA